MRKKHECNILGVKGFASNDLSILIKHFYVTDSNDETSEYDRIRKKRERLNKNIKTYLQNKNFPYAEYNSISFIFTSLLLYMEFYHRTKFTDTNSKKEQEPFFTINYILLLNNLLLRSIPKGQPGHTNTRNVTSNDMSIFLSFLCKKIDEINTKIPLTLSDEVIKKIKSIANDFELIEEPNYIDNVFLTLISTILSNNN